MERFVRETMMVANVTLAPWIRRYSVYFDQSEEDIRERGQKSECYQAYRLWLQELEKQLGTFLKREGFESVKACFKAMEIAVKSDKLRHARAVAALSDHAKKSATDAMTAGLVFMLLPVAAEDLLDMALRVADYDTFSRLMRAYHKVQQIQRDLQLLERDTRTKLRDFLITPDKKSLDFETTTTTTENLEKKKPPEGKKKTKPPPAVLLSSSAEPKEEHITSRRGSRLIQVRASSRSLDDDKDHHRKGQKTTTTTTKATTTTTAKRHHDEEKLSSLEAGTLDSLLVGSFFSFFREELTSYYYHRFFYRERSTLLRCKKLKKHFPSPPSYSSLLLLPDYCQVRVRSESRRSQVYVNVFVAL